MAKIKTVGTVSEFLSGEYKENGIKTVSKVLSATVPAVIMIMPKAALAAGVSGAFGNVHSAIMNGFDAGVVLIIIFAGASWGFGHRSKAIEILIGVSCGYILARHAVDIRNFLKGI